MSKQNDIIKHIGLNRSFSFSGQKLCFEESFKNHKGETLVRQYSCEEIYDRSRKATTRQIKHSYIVHGPDDLMFKSPPSEQSSIPVSNFRQLSIMNHNPKFKELYPNEFEDSFKYNSNRYQDIEDECTPMEVDTSTEDNAMTDTHFVSSTHLNDADKYEPINEGHTTSDLPAKVLNTSTTDLKTMRNTRLESRFVKYLKLCGIFLIPVTCALLIMRTDIFLVDDISDTFNGDNITDALEDLLYGQQDAVNKLKESFKNVNDYQLLVLTGGIGVGKTYAANIIANNFQWKNNIKTIVSPQYKNGYEESRFIRSLSASGYNLIIIDALEYQDKKSVIPFLEKIRNTNKKVIILLIFTLPEYTIDSNPSNIDLISGSFQISSELNEAKLKHNLIIFDTLNKETVKRCIRYAMAKKGLIINQYNVDHILQNVNHEYSGCKGVYSKVALLK